MKTLFSTLIICAFANVALAQFAPPAGQAGSTALYKDSSIFVSWASACAAQRGLVDISAPNKGIVTNGDSTDATGAPNAPSVLSLGDGGTATLQFATPIMNGSGWDFAVFENAFVDTFLELAFVEVSSDGLNFYRFPATSNTQDSIQVGTFGSLDASKINNLAGKYIANYGTPFDLEELKNEVGLDVNHITHVRIVDVVGSLDDAYASYDKNNRKINDPWRTDFATGGFDLDAVGVIHTWPTAVTFFDKKDFQFKVYPNPSSDKTIHVQFAADQSTSSTIEIFDCLGNLVYQENKKCECGIHTLELDLYSIPTANYFLRLSTGDFQVTEKIILK